MATKRKKVKSPTGRPSKVNPDLKDAIAGKGGARKSAYSSKAKKKKATGKKPLVSSGGMVSGPAKRRYAKKI